MKIITREEVEANAVAELGLDASSLDIASPEAIAASLRRAAGFACPCAPRTLVRAVTRALDGLVPDIDAAKASVEEVLEALTSYGDVLEVSDQGEDASRGSRVLCAAPPGFVPRASGAALLVGVVPDHRSPLPSELEAQIEHVGHVRRLPPGVLDETRTELRALGLVELSYDKWSHAPPATSPEALLARVDALLAQAPVSADIPGLLILDPTRDVAYYPARWDAPRSRSGAFVARRPQAYGADLWCYVRLEDGHPARFIDLPFSERSRGCDDAWHVQMAIDARAGHRQRARVRRVDQSTSLIELLSPVPAWARRRWDAVGEPTPPAKCLFAYRVPSVEIDEEVKFMRQRLWLDVAVAA